MNISRLKMDFKYLIINYVVMYIPSWHLRKFFLQLSGMKIGQGARIGMHTKIIAPQNIIIGERSIVNEFCHLDGRGGITIGKDVSISNYSIILTASHQKSDKYFSYYEDGVIIEDNVWIGTRAMVLNGSVLREKSVLSAGSTFKGKTEKNKVYIQGKDWIVKDRNLEEKYEIHFLTYFR